MQTIKTKFIPATNTKGFRVKATTTLGESLSIPYSYLICDEQQQHANAAIALCKKLGWEGELICGTTKEGFIFTFANEKKFLIN
jgi:hypothetical protein